MKIDVLRYSIDAVKWPASRALELGGLIMRVNNRQHIADRLQVEEPKSRATTAIKSAKKALHRQEPDINLGVVEILRAAGAMEGVAEDDLEVAEEIGPEIVNLAMELPNNTKEIEVAEKATAQSLKPVVDSMNDEVVSIRKKRK